jgi:DNA-binding IclR family transcriptional regulator
MATKKSLSSHQETAWTFLSNHGHVLAYLAKDTHMRLRDVAQCVGITERSAQRIVTDLEIAGVLTRIRTGRRNCYQIHFQTTLPHPLESGHTVGDLLTPLMDSCEKLRC